MTRLTNTAFLLTFISRFHWRFPGNWQEHICERNIRCFGSPGHLSLGSDRLNVTVCRTCTVPLWDVQRTVGSWSYRKNILGWLALRSSSSPHLYSTVVFGITFWGEEGRMTVLPLKTSANGRESAHSISLMAALLRSTHTQRCLITLTLRCQRVPRTPAWISNHTHYKVWGKITYPFLNFNCWSLGLDKYPKYPQSTCMNMITYPCWY